MAKVSAKYETVFIINCELGEEAIAELVAKFKALVEAQEKRAAMSAQVVEE